MIKATWDKHGSAFLKYVVVGVIGTLLDVGLFTLLIAQTSLGNTWTGHITAATLSFLVAVINNYVLNSLWTFQSKKTTDKKQFSKFFLVSCLGWLLNVTFLSLFSWAIAILIGSLPPLASAVAKICASGVVLIYNFIANRFWTFREALNRL